MPRESAPESRESTASVESGFREAEQIQKQQARIIAPGPAGPSEHHANLVPSSTQAWQDSDGELLSVARGSRGGMLGVQVACPLHAELSPFQVDTAAACILSPRIV